MTTVAEFIESAVAAITRGKGKDEPFVVSAAAAENLRSLLAQIEESSVTFAVVELCSLAGWLEVERGSPTARNRLIDVAASALPMLQAAAASDARSALERMASANSQVTGAQTTHRPTLSGSSPEGTARGGLLARLDLDKVLPKP